MVSAVSDWDDPDKEGLEKTRQKAAKFAKESYLDYSIYAEKRALADARDGHKPVQTRILFAMTV
jgi:DNA gyrase/topoisomerase IV subunit A